MTERNTCPRCGNANVTDSTECLACGRVVKRSAPESFPFLRIARQFDVPYSDVLAHANRYRFGEGVFMFPPYGEIDNEIVRACAEFLEVQAATIDWLTGDEC